MKIVKVTPDNVAEYGLFCIKDRKRPGARNKEQWYALRYEEGLRLVLLHDDASKPVGFIEYTPAETAWRPVHAPGFMFIHCLMVYPKKQRQSGAGARLLAACAADARQQSMAGVCAMSSKGAWITDRRIFEGQGYVQTDARGRFELMTLQWDETATAPRLRDWTAAQRHYQGWHLLYADQCPWHEKAAEALRSTAAAHGIDLQVRKLANAPEAQQAPSGFGVFSLLKDGKLLEDHYISATRFRNILKKELG